MRLAPDVPPELVGSRLERYLHAVPGGQQLATFVAVVEGLKPAMDLWIHAERWDHFARLARSFGLAYEVESLFGEASGPRANPTTHASLVSGIRGPSEAHVIIARSKDAMTRALAAAWYPLTVDGAVIERHFADHESLGRSLGYPDCCVRFFTRNNDWAIANTYYAAFRASRDVWLAESNGLLRHTMFSVTAHIPCSFSCKPTASYGEKVLAAVASHSPAFAARMRRELTMAYLCLSELRIFRLEGGLSGSDTATYRHVAAVSPTSPSDPILAVLGRGTSCHLDGNVIRVRWGDRPIAAVFARADMEGPDAPFIVACE